MKTWIVLIALSLAGCAAHAPATPSATRPVTLGGTTWRLVDLSGVAPLTDAPATLSFPDVGKVEGQASCNRFFGGVKLEGDSIELSGLGSTRMACPGPQMEQEQKYLEALQGASRYAFEGASLSIWTKRSDKPLRFTRQEP